MNRFLFCAIILFISADLSAASEVTVSAGNLKDLFQSAVEDLIGQKAADKDPLFEKFIKDGKITAPNNAGTFIVRGTDHLSFNIENSSIEMSAKCIINRKEYDILYNKSFDARQAVIILDERNDMTGCVKNSYLRDVIIEEKSQFQTKYFFQSARVVKDGDAAKVMFTQKKNLPGFVTSFNVISDIKIARDVVLTGAVKGRLSDFENGFDKTIIKYGFTVGADKNTKSIYRLSLSSVRYSEIPLPNTKFFMGKVTGSAILYKYNKVLETKSIDIKSKAHISADTVLNESLSILGEESARYFVRTIIEDSFSIDTVTPDLGTVKRGFISDQIREDKSLKEFQVQYKLKLENSSKNPYLKEFEAAFFAIFPGSANKNASHTVLIELAPVYNQKVSENVSSSLRNFKSKRCYCIITIYKGKVKVYSENVTEAAIALADEAAGKNATIKAAQKAAALVKEYYER